MNMLFVTFNQQISHPIVDFHLHLHLDKQTHTFFKKIMKSPKPQTSINPLFISIFFLLKNSLCIDQFYESCVPKHCGDGINITYPFFINDLHNSSCGYPGFNVTCSNGTSILPILGNNFTVKQIDIEKSLIQLQYPAISSNRSGSCLSDIRNLSIDPVRYTIDNATTKQVVVMKNCSVRVSAELERYRIQSCEDRNRREYVVAESDRNRRNVTEGCGGEMVKMKVDLRDGESVDGGNYEEVVARGFRMGWRAADYGVCRRSGGRCGFNTSVYQFRCLCTDRPHKVSCKSENSHRRLIIISVTVGFTLLLTLATGIFGLYRSYKRKVFTYISSKDKSLEVEDDSVYGVPVFSYAELQDATDHFDSSKELGDGGFGTVYYGKLRDGREVAVKRLYEHNYKRVQQFMNEVEILTKLRHKNLVSLYGCTSRRSRELLLVYEFISNGTVADHLHGDHAKESPLTWQTRLKIAIEIANALVYLHASDIIHRDVKTNNILLDNNYCVKVADFGLSRLLPNDATHVSTAPQGTPGYVDPEYHRLYQLTDKSDVYSFGVVLIELISSMPAIDISRSRDEISLANMAVNMIQRCALDELVDPFLASNPDAEKMTSSVAELAFRCLQVDSETRPSMTEVLDALMEIRVEESSDDIGDVTDVKSELHPPSLETEGAGLLKGRIATSPISVTAKWFSTSSGSVTPNTSVSN